MILNLIEKIEKLISTLMVEFNLNNILMEKREIETMSGFKRIVTFKRNTKKEMVCGFLLIENTTFSLSFFIPKKAKLIKEDKDKIFYKGYSIEELKTGYKIFKSIPYYHI